MTFITRLQKAQKFKQYAKMKEKQLPQELLLLTKMTNQTMKSPKILNLPTVMYLKANQLFKMLSRKSFSPLGVNLKKEWTLC